MKMQIATSCVECEREFDDITAEYDPLWNSVEWDCPNCGNDCVESNWIEGGFTALNHQLITERAD